MARTDVAFVRSQGWVSGLIRSDLGNQSVMSWKRG